LPELAGQRPRRFGQATRAAAPHDHVGAGVALVAPLFRERQAKMRGQLQRHQFAPQPIQRLAETLKFAAAGGASGQMLRTRACASGSNSALRYATNSGSTVWQSMISRPKFRPAAILPRRSKISRNLVTAACIRLLTVPSGTCKVSAISAYFNSCTSARMKTSFGLPAARQSPRR